MNWTPKIERAIRKASQLHREQKRKGADEIPYISHLFAVALILSDYTDDEDVLSAAVLHDTIEDTEYTVEELREEFGDRITEIVLGVTEPDSLPWKERKEGYIVGLRDAPNESLLVAAADKIHNLNSMIIEVKNGEEMIQLFGGTREMRIKYYGSILEIIQSRLDNPIVAELSSVYEKYKKTLES